MEALAILSIASNVAQFVELASKLISRGARYYQSSSNGGVHHAELDAAATHLARLNEKIKVTLQQSGCRSRVNNPAQQGLWEANAQCHKIAEEMLHALRRLPRPGGHRGWSTIRQAFMAIWSEEEIESLSKRLSYAREQLVLHLLVEWK